MRSLFIRKYGGPEVLELRTLPDPLPARGEVRIRVERAGLNYADIAARMGVYPDAPKPPMVVGYEVSGRVDAVGEGVEGVKTGARVFALTSFKGQSDVVCVPKSAVFPIPEGVDFDAAAAMPVNYLTANHLLFAVGNIKPGAKVLLHMAAGGVGFAVLELLRTVGSVEVFGTASASKHEALRAAGVAHPIDYRTQDYASEVRRITGGQGVQLVLDPLGGPDWRRGYRLLAPGGQLIAYGWSNLSPGTRRNVGRVVGQYFQMPRFSPLQLMDDNRTVSGVNLGRLWDRAEIVLPQMQKLSALLGSGAVKPRVDKVFALSEGVEAHRYIHERRNMGKVLFDCTR